MKKHTLVKNLSILLVFGGIIKILGLLNKIIITRTLLVEGLRYYTKLMPTAHLFIMVASFSLAPSLTEIIAKKTATRPYSNRNLMIKAFIFATFNSLLVSIIFLLSIPLISKYLLKMDDVIKTFYLFIPMLFSSTYNGIFRGYLHGHNKMVLYSSSQLLEQTVRLILTLTFIKFEIQKSLLDGINALVISMALGDAIQFIYLSFCVLLMTGVKKKCNEKAKYSDFLKPSLQMTTSNLLEAIFGFLEPIIYTFAFLLTGLSKDIADNNYAIFYGYVIPMISVSSFMITAIETSILPLAAKAYQRHDYKSYNNTVDKALFISFIPASISTFFLFFYPEIILKIFYKTTLGVGYLRLLSIPSFFSYFEGVFVSNLLVHKRQKELLKERVIVRIVTLAIMFILVSIPKINSLGLVIAEVIGILLSNIILFYYNKKYTVYSFNSNLFKKGITAYVLMIVLGLIYIKLGINTSSIILLIIIYFIASLLLIYNNGIIKNSLPLDET